MKLKSLESMKIEDYIDCNTIIPVKIVIIIVIIAN